MEKTKQAAPNELKYEETYAAQFCGFSLKNVIFGTPLVMALFAATPAVLALSHSEGEKKLAPLNIVEGFSNENIFLLGMILLSFLFMLNAIYSEVLGLPFRKSQTSGQTLEQDQNIYTLLDYYTLKPVRFNKDAWSKLCGFLYSLPSLLMETTSSLVLGCMIFYSLDNPSGNGFNLILVVISVLFYGVATKYLYSFSNFQRRRSHNKHKKIVIFFALFTGSLFLVYALKLMNINEITSSELKVHQQTFLALFIGLGIAHTFLVGLFSYNLENQNEQ
ncbi:hypothetical protein [Photobacterium sanctipauli]|nr:hypothetical protein [Photobacterium sanctipauli]